MRLLVIGGGGQLGSKIIEQGRERHSLYATYLTKSPFLDSSRVYQVDKTNEKSIQEVIAKIKPDVVIDTAALHNVDRCETNKEEAHLVNTVGTRTIAKACKTHGAKMVFVSTDYVFDGKKGLYQETDQPTPINYYGQSKLDGEQAIKEECEKHAITRTSVIYSWVSANSSQSSSGKPLNFVMWATQKLRKGEPMNIVNDQYSSPTLADSLAEALIKICEDDVIGLYHIAGKTRINRYDFTVKLAEKMGYNTSLIKPVSSSSFKQIAERPMDSSLKVEKIEKTLKMPMLSIDQALTIFKTQANEGKTQ
jgi:dTDP-4-dehydrorhamnose reductase